MSVAGTVGLGVAVGGTAVGGGVRLGAGDAAATDSAVGVGVGLVVAPRQAATKLATAPRATPTKVRRLSGGAEFVSSRGVRLSIPSPLNEAEL